MCPEVRVVSWQKGVSLSSGLKNFIGQDPAYSYGAEDLQKEWTKPPALVMVTDKQESVAA